MIAQNDTVLLYQQICYCPSSAVTVKLYVTQIQYTARWEYSIQYILIDQGNSHAV